MKKILLFVFSILGIVALSTAKEVKPEAAKLVAQNMYQQVHNEKSSLDLQLVYTSTSKLGVEIGESDPVEVPLFYVFNAGDENGFVIVSGDDNAIPILGYTTSGDFDYAELPDNFKKWLEGYKNQMRFIITNEVEATDEIATKWEKLESGQPMNTKGATSVNPLLTVTWSQSPYVNDACPYDPQAGPDNGYHAVTGCPATAMAQIMKFWNYPTQGTGFHSYNHATYGTLSANFASTTYNWAAMPSSVNGPNDAVATLMFHCGVSCEMEYGPTTSGSFVIMDGYPKEQTCEWAYKTYFGYDASTLKGLKRENYSDNAWVQMLRTDLDAGRPIQYAGFGAGGHTWVCDGYDYDYYFHMNWGWGGYADGYFLVDALNPGSGGTGSGAGTYNNGQQAVFGIKPPTGGGSTSYSISLYASVTANPNPVWYGSAFTVHTDVGNFGTGTFNGDYCAAMFDENGNFVDFVEILTGYSLNSNQHYTNGLDFKNPGTFTFLPGTYQIGVFYRPTGGDWVIVGDGSYTNSLSFSVNYSNDIELYQDMVVSGGTNIPQNQPFTVTLDVVNDGNTTFVGDFDVSLFSLDGNFAETVQTLTGANLAPGYFYDDIVFDCPGVTVPAGTYLMALMHKANNADWLLSGSTYYSNPIYVTIQEQALTADAYENNDTQSKAYSLSLNFSGNNASVATPGSNAHIGSDEDYYKIDLPSGYDYTITARVHDSYSSGNGQSYTCDMSWLYGDGANWSDTYDDVMPGDIVVKNGGTIYFHVAPYFIGQSGTYLFDVSATRTPASGINDVSASENISVYPNPATDFINIEFENKINVKSIRILDIAGKQLFNSESLNFNNENVRIPVSGFPEGSYMLLIQTGEETWQHKFIKSK